jgi:hypothetical protein
MDPVDFVDADERFIFQWNASTCELSGHQLDQTGDSVTIRTKLPAVSVIKSIRIKPSRDALALLRSDGNIVRI